MIFSLPEWQHPLLLVVLGNLLSQCRRWAEMVRIPPSTSSCFFSSRKGCRSKEKPVNPSLNQSEDPKRNIKITIFPIKIAIFPSKSFKISIFPARRIGFSSELAILRGFVARKEQVIWDLRFEHIPEMPLRCFNIS